MTLFEAIISGIVQGLTEFLPISSSGHLVILHRIIGLQEPQIAFDIFLHVGTLIAIFIVFWRDILDVFGSKKKTGILILLGTAPTAIFIALFGEKVAASFTNVRFVGAMLIVTGLWLILGNFFRYGTTQFSGFKAIFIGLAQGIAAFPGISRSGATISTALFLGIDPKSAARFSFLLAIPAIIGAFLLKIKDFSLNGSNMNNYILGLVVSCIVGILSLKLLLRVLYRNKFHLFGIYCIVAGLLVLGFLK
ncbi:MAG: undecaprenyl-diphosphate phosphatase [Candidatus Omnitrophica bacterium]|nr:undecaprenyl-diphosphate phosphatase [Candidatus Omnitrophota bacterium]